MIKIQFIRCYCAVLLLAAVAAFQVRAEVKLPSVFGDNMVLQQQSQVAVWGWTKPNASVKVTGSWNSKSYSAKSDSKGYWKVKIQTPVAGFTPYTLTISDGKVVTLKNVLIGEVWICSGQSNMNMAMNRVNKPDDINYSNNQGIRCFTAEKISSIKPLDDCKGKWEVADPQTVPFFTATGYYFARLINSALNVPVGLISTSWGGSLVEAWMTPASLKDIPEKPIPATEADVKSVVGSPTVLYNSMLNPFVGYGIRGAIWYQGESSKNESELYAKMFDRMVRGWRDIWGVGEFPFYYCQIAPYNYNDGKLHSAYFREAQSKGMQTPNTGMAVLMDADSPYDIHPVKKKDAGERLAFWALAKTYGLDKINYRSPEYKSLKVEGRVAIVSFDLFGANLTDYGKDLRNFTIAGSNQRFYPAKAALLRNQVYLFSPNVPEPVAVRYCWDDISPTELFSAEGNLPVSSFRTDTW